jgi:hypothetical protein
LRKRRSHSYRRRLDYLLVTDWITVIDLHSKNYRVRLKKTISNTKILDKKQNKL